MPKIINKVDLTPFKQYFTFQAHYEIYPKNDLDIDGCFAKMILTVTDWIRDRLGKNPDNYPEFLDAYPPAAKYKKFDLDTTVNQGQSVGFDIRTFYWKEESLWSLRLYEMSSNPDVSNQSFVTEITVKKDDELVHMAIRTTCREPSGTKDADIYRLRFIRHKLLKDKDIIVTYSGSGIDYPMSLTPLILNGNSNIECQKFIHQVLKNPTRHYPVLIFPKKFYDEHLAKTKFAGDSAGFASIVLIDGKANKLFIKGLGIMDYTGFHDEQISALFNVTQSEEIDFQIETYEVKPGRNLLPKYHRALMAKYHESMRTFGADFTDIDFYSTARQKCLEKGLGDDESSQKMQELEEELNRLLIDLESSQNNEISLTKENENLKQQLSNTATEKQELDKKYSRIVHQCENKDLEIETLKAELEELTEHGQERLETKDGDLKTALSILGKHKALFNIPISNRKEDILQWIEDNYSDYLILHNRAKRSFIDDDRLIDLKKVCYYIHYLYGYTKLLSEENTSKQEVERMAEEYDILGLNIQVTRSGRRKGAYRLNGKAYKIDMTAYPDAIENYPLLTKHIKSGNNNKSVIRIYFYYDNQMKKSVIGYMPDHL